MKLRHLIASIAAACLLHAVDAQAQFRTLPADAKRATTGEPIAMPYVKLAGKTMKLAPGAVIYDQNNRSLIQGALPPGAAVLYTTDLQGDVGRIYILSDSEQQQLARKR